MQNITSIRFNKLLCKSISNSINLTYTQSSIVQRAAYIPFRSFASKSDSASKPKKRATKKDEKIQKLLKQYPDPRQPKRPQNAFFRFSSEYRQNIDLEMSPETMGRISKRIGSAWANLSDHEKAKYTKVSTEEYESYKAAKQRYEESDRPQQWLAKITRLAEERPPQSGYQLFVQKRSTQLKQNQHASSAPTGILSTVANEWSALDQETKKQWTGRAKQNYSQWEAKMRTE